jgi:uncharacterized protein (TIGR00730 family)
VAAICVYCASSERIDAQYLELATDVGRAIAAAGYDLVSGGGRVSMMGAVASAVRGGGRHTVGVIPQHLIPYEVADTAADELIVVDTMRERKRIMDERSIAFIALPGGLGTFEELFEMWTSASLGMHDNPVIVLDPDGFYDGFWAYLESLIDKGFVRREAFDALHRVTTIEAALAVVDASRASQEPVGSPEPSR